VKILAMVVGAVILLTTAHVSILATGGYGGPHAYITLGVAAGVAVASIAVGRAWAEKRRALAIFLVVAIAAGEVFALLSTAERLTAAREASQSPLRQALEARHKLETRVAKAEAAVIALPDALPACKRRCRARPLPRRPLSPRAPSVAARPIAGCCCRHRQIRTTRKSKQRGATWQRPGQGWRRQSMPPELTWPPSRLRLHPRRSPIASAGRHGCLIS
jgi:hypothetical protein